MGDKQLPLHFSVSPVRKSQIPAVGTGCVEASELTQRMVNYGCLGQLLSLWMHVLPLAYLAWEVHLP